MKHNDNHVERLMLRITSLFIAVSALLMLALFSPFVTG